MEQIRSDFSGRTSRASFLALMALGLAFLGGCGSRIGTFIDSPVQGLTYQTDTLSGTTGRGGQFLYRRGETVTFSIGSLMLGSVEGWFMVTPIDIVPAALDATDPRVTNICVLLQTLDEDGDLNNGIKISSAIADIVANYAATTDFDQNPGDFAADPNLLAMLAELNAAGVFTDTVVGDRVLQTAEAAQAHLVASIGPRKVVATQYGKVSGYAPNEGTWAWHGIPFARPPLGDRRWRAPGDPEPWIGIRHAVARASQCTQILNNQFWHNYVPTTYIGSEDCLYLDIYRPRTRENNLPVYVYLHGGAYYFGGAKGYHGTPLAQHGNIIVVVPQYRLSVLGWLTHPALRENENDLDASGNYGTLDQLKALEWVQENIEAFGGDPSKVTLGGQSAGGHAVLNAMISPLAGEQDLFQQASIESAASYSPGTLEDGDAATNTIIDWLLVDDGTAGSPAEAATIRESMSSDELKAYLRGKIAAEVIHANFMGVGLGLSMPMPHPFGDGTVLPSTDWFETIALDAHHKVPVLIGGQEYEYKNFQPLYAPLFALFGITDVPSSAYTWFDVYAILDGTLTLDEVFPLQRDKDFYATLYTLFSQRWRAKGVDSVARALKENDPSEPVYAYRFDWAGGGDADLADFDFLFGAGHAMEVPFFFGGDESLFGLSFTTTNEAGRKALQGAMIDYLASFVRTGNPNLVGSSLLEWPQWSNAAGEPRVIVFDADLTTTQLEIDTREETEADFDDGIAQAKVDFNSPSERLVTNLLVLLTEAQ